MVDEEFEMVSLSPIRRLEKRVEKLEASTPTVAVKEFLQEIIDIIKLNQQLVDQLVKANDALRVELSRLPARIENLTSKIDELLELIKAAAKEEVIGPETFKSLIEKMEQLIETNKKIAESNEIVLSTLEELEKRLKKPPLPLTFKTSPPMQKPIQK